ncbi:hypothetical protein M9H77_23389 [Catharanthus roseus]|uniref:Uncharacterized protein n=1 Tax=Catharanthus roseus TaxID=4058 RepID=A0ACC0AX83_CATRO|nr:hypothetical protein M9H77_23389 [Catharanthus roseus]
MNFGMIAIIINYLIVINRSGHNGRTVTASSRRLRGRHITSDIHTTPLIVDPVGPGSSIQPSPIPSRSAYPLPASTASRYSSYRLYRYAVGFYIHGRAVVRIFQMFPPYSSQHMDYYESSGHVPSYTLGLGEHNGDKGGEKTVQAGGDDAEHIHGWSERKDVEIGGGGTIVVVPPSSSKSKLGRGKEVKFLRDTARSEMEFGSQS